MIRPELKNPASWPGSVVLSGILLVVYLALAAIRLAGGQIETAITDLLFAVFLFFNIMCGFYLRKVVAQRDQLIRLLEASNYGHVVTYSVN